MNIAFLSSAFLREMKESTTITLISLAKELIYNGHNVVVVTEARKGYPAEEAIRGVPVYRLASGRLFGHARTVAKLQKKLGIKFDVVHGFSAANGLVLRTYFAGFAAKGARLVHTLKSYPKSYGGPAWLLNLADRVTVPTEAMMRKLSFVSAGKIKVVRSFIDTSKFKPLNKSYLKKRYGFEGKRVVLYYGSLFESKGVKYLLKAFSDFDVRDAVLLLAVRHELPADYKEIVGKLDNVEVVEGVNVVDYVNMADAVVLPYTNMVGTEGNPSCLLEAVACNTPVVTTRQPELLEIFDEGELFYADAADVKSLKHEISSALLNTKEAASRAERARKKIYLFDIKRIANEFLSIYTS